ncbi:MAG: carboxypeptidase regulatory-like domain-containing protein [Planctomycetia bacterium]
MRPGGALRAAAGVLGALLLLAGARLPALRSAPLPALPGRVQAVDEAGTALAGAELLRCERRALGSGVLGARTPVLATADAQGWVTLPGEALDVRADPPFAVRAPGHAPRLLAALGPGDRLALFPAQPHGSRVRYAGGATAAGAALLLVPVGAPSAVALELRADGEGRFQSPWVGPGTWRLVLERAAGRGLVLGGLRSGDWPGEVRAPQGSGVAGRLLDALAKGTQGAAGVRVRLVRLPRVEASGPAPEATSDADGRFLLGPLEPGVYELALLDADWRFDQPEARVEVPEGITREQSWYVMRRPQLRCRVLRLQGEPLEGASVRLLYPEGVAVPPAQPRSAPPVAVATAQGWALLERLEPLPGVRRRLTAPGHAPLLSEPLEVGRQGVTEAGAYRMEAGFRLELEVRDPDQRPQPGVRVLVVPAAPPDVATRPAWAALARRGETGEGGLLELDHLPPDDALVALEAPGCVPTLLRVNRPASGGARKERVTLARAPALAGAVRDALGQPVAGLAVRLRAPGLEAGEVPGASTDAAGRFEVRDLRPRAYDLELWRGPQLLLTRDGVLPGEAALELVLPPLHALRGSVAGLQAQGPGALALLEAQVVEADGTLRWRSMAQQALPAGLTLAWYAFEGLAPGAYAVRVAQAGRDTDALPATLEDRDVDLPQLVLPAPGSVAGSVLDVAGRPVLGATLTLARLRADLDAPALPGTPLRAASDDRGQYLFPAVAPGLWRIEVREPGRGSDLEVLRVEEGEALVLRDLLVDGGGSIEGVVRDGRGQRLDGVRLQARRLDADAEPEETRTRPDGGYALLGLAPGTWRVQCLEGVYGSVRREALVEVQAREVARLDFEAAGAGSILGRVTRDGTRVAGASVRLEWLPPEGLALARVERAVTDSYGEFRVDGLAAGPYRVLLEDGATRTGGECWLEEDDLLELDLELWEGRVLGEVRDVEGRPVPGAQVEARPSVPVAGELASRARAGADGAFALTGLPAGRYDLRARARGRAEGAYRGAPAEPPGVQRPVIVTVGRGGQVEVEVRGPSGRPVGGTRLSVTLDPGQEQSTLEAVTGPSGRLTLAGVPAGEVRVSAYARDVGRASGTVRVGEGETRTLELRIEAPGSLRLRVLGEGADPTPRTRIDVVALASGEVVARRRPLQPDWWSLLFGREAGSGLLVLRDLAPGDYELRVNGGPRYEPVRTTVRVHAGEATEAEVLLPSAR